jgi:hypothetical protein
MTRNLKRKREIKRLRIIQAIQSLLKLLPMAEKTDDFEPRMNLTCEKFEFVEKQGSYFKINQYF